MTGQTALRQTPAGNIGDEAIYLRIEQLQKGLLQFTDSTNACNGITGIFQTHRNIPRPLIPWP
jgi:hypothetical protein